MTKGTQRHMREHGFKVGAIIRYAAGRSPLTRKASNAGARLDRFEIVRQLPNEGGGFQYRIRSKADGHERIVVEGEIGPEELG